MSLNLPDDTNPTPIDASDVAVVNEQGPLSVEPPQPLAPEQIPAPPSTSPSTRAPTPASRTSSPPLTSAPKKFSAVNVTKKFLSKAGSPAQPGPAKLAPVRPSASPIPISTSSRLLSTKLVSTSKSSTSPNPPPPAPAASPWAKPVSEQSPLQQPAPSKPRLGIVGLGASAKTAWRPVAAEGRKPGLGLARDFPTAKEVAEGKQAAALAAQAHAAHNQAIMQSLNAFTHLEPNAHRWDEEDEDDEMMDFGDGATYAEPVSQSERFAEDFDRSWPGRSAESSRVLFNASSNRLEPSLSRPTQPRLATRPEPPHTREAPRVLVEPTRVVTRDPPPKTVRDQPRLNRTLPPHLQDTGRMIPPHMIDTAVVTPQLDSKPTIRQPWGAPRPSLSNDPEPDRHVVPKSSAPPAPVISPVESAPPSLHVDAQAAEMHTAAEKARLRRLAEEAEREAAAERARRKAKELEERLAKAQSPAAPAPAPAPAAPPGFTAIAPRPSPSQPVVNGPLVDTWRRHGNEPNPSNVRLPTSDLANVSPVNGAEMLPKKESNFDSMLARIQAAMAEARASPMVEESVGPIPPMEPEPSKPSPPTAAIPPEPIPPSSVPEYFDVTQPPPPRSPPPAWRTFTIKIPKGGPSRPPAPSRRSSLLLSPQGWIMSYEPALDLDPRTLSLTDMLLPIPLSRRFQKHVDTLPIVSISPWQLPVFERRKKKVVEAPMRDPVVPPPTESLLPEPGWQETLPPRKTRSPVKSTAAKAERDGRFTSGVGLPGPAPEHKPGVRFMVSSELEGDSLLDEVNKMSVETVGEGSSEAIVPTTPGSEVGAGRVGADMKTPKTPPSHANSTRAPSSPNANPWPTPRDLKSVWEQAPAPPAAPETPLYPSLNAPSSADPPAPQPLPKMSYPHNNTFTGASRQSPGQPYFGSTDNQGMYARTNGGFPTVGQQGLWSASAFGSSMATPGFAFSAKSSAPVDKAAQAFGANGDYRYGQGGYNQGYSNEFTTQGQAFGRQNVGNTQMYGGFYGAPGQGQRPPTGRFGQANGSADYGNIGSNAYFGGLNQRVYSQGYGAPGAVEQQAGRGGGAARKMW